MLSKFKAKINLFSSSKHLRFLILSGLLYLLFYLIYQFIVRKFTFYDQKFIGVIITHADFVLQSLGYQTFKILQDRDFQVLGIDGASGVWIGSNCNAISLFFLFAVFIVAYPGKTITKLWYVPAGIIAIHLLNVLRVVALAMVNYSAPEYLAFNHTYTFTFIVYGFIFLLWMLWINHFSDKKNEAAN